MRFDLIWLIGLNVFNPNWIKLKWKQTANSANPLIKPLAQLAPASWTFGELRLLNAGLVSWLLKIDSIWILIQEVESN